MYREATVDATFGSQTFTCATFGSQTVDAYLFDCTTRNSEEPRLWLLVPRFAVYPEWSEGPAMNDKYLKITRPHNTALVIISATTKITRIAYCVLRIAYCVLRIA